MSKMTAEEEIEQIFSTLSEADPSNQSTKIANTRLATHAIYLLERCSPEFFQNNFQRISIIFQFLPNAEFPRSFERNVGKLVSREVSEPEDTGYERWTEHESRFASEFLRNPGQQPSEYFETIWKLASDYSFGTWIAREFRIYTTGVSQKNRFSTPRIVAQNIKESQTRRKPIALLKSSISTINSIDILASRKRLIEFLKIELSALLDLSWPEPLIATIERFEHEPIISLLATLDLDLIKEFINFQQIREKLPLVSKKESELSALRDKNSELLARLRILPHERKVQIEQQLHLSPGTLTNGDEYRQTHEEEEPEESFESDLPFSLTLGRVDRHDDRDTIQELNSEILELDERIENLKKEIANFWREEQRIKQLECEREQQSKLAASQRKPLEDELAGIENTIVKTINADVALRTSKKLEFDGNLTTLLDEYYTHFLEPLYTEKATLIRTRDQFSEQIARLIPRASLDSPPSLLERWSVFKEKVIAPLKAEHHDLQQETDDFDERVKLQLREADQSMKVSPEESKKIEALLDEKRRRPPSSFELWQAYQSAIIESKRRRNAYLTQTPEDYQRTNEDYERAFSRESHEPVKLKPPKDKNPFPSASRKL